MKRLCSCVIIVNCFDIMTLRMQAVMCHSLSEHVYGMVSVVTEGPAKMFPYTPTPQGRLRNHIKPHKTPTQYGRPAQHLVNLNRYWLTVHAKGKARH